MFQDPFLSIIYEDNHLLVIDKPPLLLTIPTKQERDSVQTRGQTWLKQKYKKSGEAFLQPVHLLDRVASGLVVCAKTGKSASRLYAQIRAREWEKLYLARHDGALPSIQGTLRHFLRKMKFHAQSYCQKMPETKEALLHYWKIKPGFVAIQPTTGYYHQIRVQLSSINCPICGDKKYRATSSAFSCGIDLHHTQVRFSHPISKNLITLNSNAPFSHYCTSSY